MKLDEIEKLAREVAERGSPLATVTELARFALLALPVVRAAVAVADQDIELHPVAHAADHDVLAALYDSIATLRRGMGGVDE